MDFESGEHGGVLQAPKRLANVRQTRARPYESEAFSHDSCADVASFAQTADRAIVYQVASIACQGLGDSRIHAYAIMASSILSIRSSWSASHSLRVINGHYNQPSPDIGSLPMAAEALERRYASQVQIASILHCNDSIAHSNPHYPPVVIQDGLHVHRYHSRPSHVSPAGSGCSQESL